MLCVWAWGGHCCPIIRASRVDQQLCGEGSKLRTAGEEGLLGTLSGNYGLTPEMEFLRWPESVEGKMSAPRTPDEDQCGSLKEKDVEAGGQQ